MKIFFTVPGMPRGKGRPKIGRTPQGRSLLFADPSTKAYEEEIAVACRSAMKGWTDGARCLSLQVEAIFPMPEESSAEDGDWCGKKPDADNILKVVADALTRIVWDDDRVIARAGVEKTYGERPGLAILIEELPE